MAVPNIIGGVLPWAGGNAASAFSAAARGDAAGIASGYQQAYNNALAMNMANYNNIMAGYQQTAASRTTAQDAIAAGYTDLYNNVLSQVEQLGGVRRREIDDAAEQFLAKQSQQMIDRGLGNTTIQSSLEMGVEGDRGRRQTELSESLARQRADYMSNLGLAGLADRRRSVEADTAWSSRQLDFMNSVDAAYPDAGLYASLAKMAGDNAAAERSFGGGSFGGGGGGPAPKVGYVPDRGPYSGGGLSPAAVTPSGMAPGGGYGGFFGGYGDNWLPQSGGSATVAAGYDQPPAAFDGVGKGYAVGATPAFDAYTAGGDYYQQAAPGFTVPDDAAAYGGYVDYLQPY